MVECGQQADRGARMTPTQSQVACGPRSSLGPDWSLLGPKLGACLHPRGQSPFSWHLSWGPSLCVCSHPAWGQSGLRLCRLRGLRASPSPHPLCLPSVALATLCPQEHISQKCPGILIFPSKVSLHVPPGFCPHLLFQQNSGVYQPHRFFWVVLARSWIKPGSECDWLPFIEEETEAFERLHLLPKVTQRGEGEALRL